MLLDHLLKVFLFNLSLPASDGCHCRVLLGHEQQRQDSNGECCLAICSKFFFPTCLCLQVMVATAVSCRGMSSSAKIVMGNAAWRFAQSFFSNLSLPAGDGCHCRVLLGHEQQRQAGGGEAAFMVLGGTLLDVLSCYLCCCSQVMVATAVSCWGMSSSAKLVVVLLRTVS
jgi:hypothetical protein